MILSQGKLFERPDWYGSSVSRQANRRDHKLEFQVPLILVPRIEDTIPHRGKHSIWERISIWNHPLQESRSGWFRRPSPSIEYTTRCSWDFPIPSVTHNQMFTSITIEMHAASYDYCGWRLLINSPLHPHNYLLIVHPSMNCPAIVRLFLRNSNKDITTLLYTMISWVALARWINLHGLLMLHCHPPHEPQRNLITIRRFKRNSLKIQMSCCSPFTVIGVIMMRIRSSSCVFCSKEFLTSFKRFVWSSLPPPTNSIAAPGLLSYYCLPALDGISPFRWTHCGGS